MKNILAITLPWGVYYNPYLTLTYDTVLHEQEHVRQIKANGIFKFYSLYLYEYLRNLFLFGNHTKAYENISFEIAARKAEER